MQTEAAQSLGELADRLLLDAALENIPYGFCVWSPQFRLVMWNAHYLEIYGFPKKEIRRGMHLTDVVALSQRMGNHADQTAEEFYKTYTAELLSNRSGLRYKSQERVHGDRIIETAHAYSSALGWVVTHEDVTDEIAREENADRRKRELELQNLRLDAAVNNIGQGLCMFDRHGHLVICNRPYARIYNLPEPLLKPGTPLHDILGYLFETGMFTGGTREEYLAWREDVIHQGEYGKAVHELNGRTVIMQHHPMPDGGWVSTHEDITEQQEIESRIQHLARHDALTDLPNRAQFLAEMDALEMALKRGEKAAVFYIDLDHFKHINDTLGHSAGDQLIKLAGERLALAKRDSDVLARLGGDEFALLLRPVAGERDAQSLAEQIIETISRPFIIGEQKVEIGVSVGIAMAPGDGRLAETLIKNADIALYKAKAEGRSTYHFFEAELDAALRRRRAIEAGLRGAIERNELHLAFQPLLGLEADRIACAEALLRWEFEGRTIAPDEFIPVAEETGLIVPIGAWVLRQACLVARDWPKHVRVAVNLSAVQFRSANLFSQVEAILAETGFDPTRLELEITESLLLAQNDQVLRTLHRLRSLGIRISMDDFGTGYSSLSYLRSFPFDKIKIDRSFMRGLATPGDSLAIIKAIIGLGKSLGMTTTAEGVETPEQLELMRANGCDEIQGFYFSKPVSAADFALLLATADASQKAGAHL
ncbi:hypothetical protein GCM10007989_19460 [Devosia pacifica]|uniref:Diguanylate cyclase (GGDEF)-like protein n=1 Tax=Devosia pacifica TaxID=1335967 RepID=A0A918S761_9HYPH|nr:EAL domain-containing protein [Devosia pacifica]GHA23937.1 hypothetical protein GCM10007989_19460 [Devosia pacifica]